MGKLRQLRKRKGREAHAAFFQSLRRLLRRGHGIDRRKSKAGGNGGLPRQRQRVVERLTRRLAIQSLDVVLHITVGKPGIEINRRCIDIAIARQHIPPKPSSAVFTLRRQTVARMLDKPGLHFRIPDRGEVMVCLTHIAEQQIQTSQKGHRV